MPEAKTSPRRIQAVMRQRRCLELRMAGRTYQEIADTVGYKTPQGAILAVQAALQKTLQAPADEWRSLTAERLTKILQVFWPRMLQSDEKAADRVFRAVADLRALLGLDAPIKTAFTDPDGGRPTVQIQVVSEEGRDLVERLLKGEGTE